MKNWKQMSKDERRAHVKETAEWIRKEIEKDKKKYEARRALTQHEINQMWANAGCLAANSKYNPYPNAQYGGLRGIFGSWI